MFLKCIQFLNPAAITQSPAGIICCLSDDVYVLSGLFLFQSCTAPVLFYTVVKQSFEKFNSDHVPSIVIALMNLGRRSKAFSTISNPAVHWLMPRFSPIGSHTVNPVTLNSFIPGNLVCFLISKPLSRLVTFGYLDQALKEAGAEPL